MICDDDDDDDDDDNEYDSFYGAVTRHMPLRGRLFVAKNHATCQKICPLKVVCFESGLE